MAAALKVLERHPIFKPHEKDVPPTLDSFQRDWQNVLDGWCMWNPFLALWPGFINQCVRGMLSSASGEYLYLRESEFRSPQDEAWPHTAPRSRGAAYVLFAITWYL